jgi:hypothetical protein
LFFPEQEEHNQLLFLFQATQPAPYWQTAPKETALKVSAKRMLTIAITALPVKQGFLKVVQRSLLPPLQLSAG